MVGHLFQKDYLIYEYYELFGMCNELFGICNKFILYVQLIIWYIQ